MSISDQSGKSQESFCDGRPVYSPEQQGESNDLSKRNLVSIIVPTHNRPESLKRTLDSILVQSYKSFEIIVVDDGSELDISKAIRGYPVRKIVRQKHSGANIARNRGFAQSNGEFVLFCDDDVELNPLFLEKMVQAMKANPEKAYAYCGFDVDGKIIGMEPFDPEKLKKHNYIDTVSLIVRSKFPGFDPKIKRLQDWDLWLTMLERGCEGIWVPEVLFRKTWKNYPRITDDSNPDSWTYMHAQIAVAEKHNTSPFPEALEALVRVYHLRPDLQEVCPEARWGDYRRLIDWAYNVVTGKFLDETCSDLRAHEKAYQDMRIEKEKMKSELAQQFTEPMGKLLALYAIRPDLQSEFPEAKNGEYSRLLQWARDFLATGRNGASGMVLDSAEWYKRNRWLTIDKELSNARNELARHESELQSLMRERTGLAEELSNARNALASTSMELAKIKRSFGYRFARFLASFLNRVIRLMSGTR